MAATDFQHLFAAEIHLGCGAAVLLDAEPVDSSDSASGSAIGGSSS